MSDPQIYDHLDFDIIDYLPGHVFLKDAQSKYISTNQSFAKASGVEKKGQLLGQGDFEMPWLERESRKFVQDDKHVMHTEKPLLEIQETLMKRAVLTHKFPLFDPKRKVIGVLGMFFYLSKGQENQDSKLAHLLSLRNFNAITDPRKQFIAMGNELVCLTKREIDCAHLVLLGYSAKEMAHRLGISVYTVQIHIKNLKNKLKCNSRSMLVDKILSSDLVKVIINR